MQNILQNYFFGTKYINTLCFSLKMWCQFWKQIVFHYLKIVRTFHYHRVTFKSASLFLVKNIVAFLTKNLGHCGYIEAQKVTQVGISTGFHN